MRMHRTGLIPVLAFMIFAASCRGRQTENAAVSEEQMLRDKITFLGRQEQVLSADYALAKSPGPYLSVDCANRKVDLKVHGRAIRSFGIGRIQRTGGDPEAVEVWTKIEIKPLQDTARSRMVPGSGEATTTSVATQAPWGPQRMPSDYDLICKGDLLLEFRALPAESRSRFVRWFVGGYRRMADWSRDVFTRHHKGYKQAIEVWMNEDDARLLFWSLPKQFGILLVNIS